MTTTWRWCSTASPTAFVESACSTTPTPTVSRRPAAGIATSGSVGCAWVLLGRADAGRAADLDRLPVLEAMEELGMVLWFYGPPDQLRLLPMALRAVPGLRVVLNHLGFCPTGYDVDEHGRPRIETVLPPPTLDLVLELSEFAEVMVMFSGQYAFSQQPPPYADLTATVQAIGRAYGLDRLVWASDWPWIKDVPGLRRPAVARGSLLPRGDTAGAGGSDGRQRRPPVRVLSVGGDDFVSFCVSVHARRGHAR